MIQNTIDPHITTYIATLRDSAQSHDRSVLIFKKYGDRYFLHEVFSPAGMNVSLFRSKEERHIRQQTAMVKLDDA